LLRFLSNATIETEGLLASSIGYERNNSDGDVSMVMALWSSETSNKLVSCVREPEELGRVRSAIDFN
jgi:hypothetical protein